MHRGVTVVSRGGGGGTDYSTVDSPGGPLSRGDCPQHDKTTHTLVLNQ